MKHDSTKYLHSDITDYYSDEYFKKQSKKQTGLWGGLNRFFSHFYTPSNKELSRIILPGMMIAFSSQLLTGVFGLASAIVTPIALPIMFGTIAIATSSLMVTRYRARKDLRKDINSGKLLKRYNNECLKPQSENISNKIRRVSINSNLKAGFNSNEKPKKNHIQKNIVNKQKPRA